MGTTMVTPDEVTTDTLDAMSGDFLTAAEWEDACSMPERTAAELADAAAYGNAEDAHHEAADAAIEGGIARMIEDGAWDDEDDDPGYDPTPDGEPDPPAGPAAARPASAWIAEFEARMERANWTGNALHYGEAQGRRNTVARLRCRCTVGPLPWLHGGQALLRCRRPPRPVRRSRIGPGSRAYHTHGRCAAGRGPRRLARSLKRRGGPIAPPLTSVPNDQGTAVREP